MEKLQQEHARLVKEAKVYAGVGQLMKVYERFQRANEITAEYLRLISPVTYQSNSNKSLLSD